MGKKSTKTKWTKEDDDFILNNYSTMDIKNIINFLNRSRKSIYHRANYLGIYRINCQTRWTTQSFQAYVNKITNGEYELLSEYIKSAEKVAMKHLVCGNVYNVTPNKFVLKQRCPKCQKSKSYHKLTQEQFEERVHKINNGEFKVIGKYEKTTTSIEIYHTKCNKSFIIKPCNFLISKKCKNCVREDKKNNFHKIERKNVIKTHEKFINEIEEKYGNEYIIIDRYRKSHDKILVQHKNCGESWYITPDNLLRGYGCPKCASSKGEKFVNSYLKKNNINFIPQYYFDDCRGVNGGLLRFDFVIIENNQVVLLIEIQGKQHYEPIEIFGGEKQFCIQIQHDDIKRQYSKNKNIRLLEISYKQFGNIDKLLHKELTINDWHKEKEVS